MSIVFNIIYIVILTIFIPISYFSIGRGAISSNPTVTVSTSFTASNPIFTLFGDTSAGPPTTNIWRKDNVVITNNTTSISFTGSHDDAGHRAANYRSTLIVTGRQPGVNQYSVIIRATTTDIQYHYRW